VGTGARLKVLRYFYASVGKKKNWGGSGKKFQIKSRALRREEKGTRRLRRGVIVEGSGTRKRGTCA